MLTVPGVTNYGQGALVTALIKYIFSSEFIRFKKFEIEMVVKNVKARGQRHDGFFYQGEYFTNLDGAQRNAVKAPLHFSLVGEMDIFLADKRLVTNEIERVKQALAIVLKPCRSAQDVRDALPNCLSGSLDQIKNLERTRPEAYTIEGNERAMRQYNMLREKIEFYTAMKLIY